MGCSSCDLRTVEPSDSEVTSGFPEHSTSKPLSRIKRTIMMTVASHPKPERTLVAAYFRSVPHMP
eukprot:925162-Rhodomonas_salina.2